MSSRDMPAPRKLWEHPDPQGTYMAQFMRQISKKRGIHLNTFSDLYKWSVGDRRDDFWRDLWDYVRIVYEGDYNYVVEPNVRMDRVPRWFSGVRLNFAENILYRPSARSRGTLATDGKEDGKIAVTEVREACTEIRNVTWGELRAKVGRLASAMHSCGVTKGDRIAVVASNSVDTLSVFLAITSLGGLFSSSSTDMGVKGILDRLTQIRPKWLFMDDAALYNGKKIDLREKMSAVVEGMETVQEFQGIVSMPRWSTPLEIGKLSKVRTLHAFLNEAKTDQLKFKRVDFADPFLVVYSSGTTGQPKCIVHSSGGVLLSAHKEGVLHRNWNSSTVVLQYTTTGWIMYLSCVLSLLHGARAILYDGSPFLPDPKAFLRLIGDQKVTHLGASPRYFQTLATASLAPREVTDLSFLERVTSTGMVLSDALFAWFYDVGFPAQVQLANISGGTDLAGCFGMENPLMPVYVGGCQGPSIGTPVEIYDSTIETPSGDGAKPPKGAPVPDGEPGELVATKSFPNMPVMFWGDDGPRRYFDAYFARFDNVWSHGDFVQVIPATGQMVFLGRADGVLNPSGVRFGSAEIYAVVDKSFGDKVADSICVGQRRPTDSDESVMLFLKMQPGVAFSQQLADEIRSAVARECSKRHVPKYIFETPDIPTTVNLKKVELPVKQIVSGKVIKPSGTLLNPQSLDYYYQFAKVEEIAGAPVKSKL